jgi:tRNA dimethylallyltransferase
MTDVQAVCLMGPTACGKTDLALEIASAHPFEIVSVDSAVVYRGMDVGTAKPSQAVRSEIPHHLIDIRDPADAYSAADFRGDALRVMNEIIARGRIPLLVGGTMLYFKALKHGLADLPSAAPEVRNGIVRIAEREGWPAVHERLAEVDPEAAARINPNDPQRLQRALEVYEVTGRPMTELQREGSQPCPLGLLEIAIMPPDRADLHQRIGARFNQMLANGLVEEVRALFERGDLTPDMPSIKAVGYRQVWQHLAGELDREEMVEKGIVATRQLAKRQYTWLRGWEALQVLEEPDPSAILKILTAGSILEIRG